ncbi:MAG: hypothetical protein ACM3ST_10990 [Bdellovibrio bacteriovorus]
MDASIDSMAKDSIETALRAFEPPEVRAESLHLAVGHGRLAPESDALYRLATE